MTIAEWVYILCAFTSAACSFLLFRSYQHSRTPLLFWSAICFVGFGLNSLLLFVDLAVLVEQDLQIIRILPAVVGVGALVYGLVQEASG